MSHDPLWRTFSPPRPELERACRPPTGGRPAVSAVCSGADLGPRGGSPRCEEDEGPALPALVFPEKRLDDLGRRLGLRRGEQNDLVALRAALLHGQRAVSALWLAGRRPAGWRWPAGASRSAGERPSLQALSPGFYAFADSLDDDGCGATDIPLRATLLIRRRDAGSALSIDLRRQRRCRLGSVKSNGLQRRPPSSKTSFRLAESHLASAAEGGPWLPRNDGLLAAISLRLRRGSILAAEPPAALSLGLDETAQRLSES